MNRVPHGIEFANGDCKARRVAGWEVVDADGEEGKVCGGEGADERVCGGDE